MTFVGAIFLGQTVFKENKFGRERQSLINKKERNTEGEKRQINQNYLCNCTNLCMDKISWTDSIQGKKLGEKEIAEVTKEKETQKDKKDRLNRIICPIAFVWTKFLGQTVFKKEV